MAYYLKWPTDTGSGSGNNKLCQISGIATTGNVNISLEFAENVPATGSTSAYGFYLYDGRRTLDSTTQGAGGYFLKYAGAIEQSGCSNYKLNGVASTSGGWQTALANDVYSFDSGAQADGVISIGARFNQAEMLPGLTLKKIIITDSGGAHTVDMSSSGGTSNQFTSTDGVITLKLFGFTGSAHWVFYSSGSSYSDTLSGTAFASSINSLTSTRAKADTLSGASYSSSVGNLTATKGYANTLSGISLASSISSLTATRGYSSVLNASTYLSSISSLTSTITSASGYDSLLDGLLYTSSLGNMLSTVQRASVLNGIAFNSSFGSLTTGLGYNSALSGAVYSSFMGSLTSTRSGEVTVTIEGYTIKFADSVVAAAYANNGISAGYATDILEITWQH